MYPEILHISFLHTYGWLVALAFLAALWMAARLSRAAGLDPDAVTDLGLYCGLAAFVGAKIMLLAVAPGDFFSWDTLEAGGVFYGGLLAALAVGWWYMRRTGLAPLATADVFAPAIALGHGIGRLGCFSAGCCWGVKTSVPWAVTFTNPVSNALVGVPLGVRLHPTQLYEAFAEFVIFGILYMRARRAHAPGDIIGLYILLYGAARFVVEFFRFHEQGNLWGGPLDTSQWISLGLMAAGAVHFLGTRRRSGLRAERES